MARKNKSKVDLKPRTPLSQDHAGETSVCQVPRHEEIRSRAYEIYLERGDRPGDELDDWLRAEREVQKVSLFTRDWNRLEERRRLELDDGGADHANTRSRSNLT